LQLFKNFTTKFRRELISQIFLTISFALLFSFQNLHSQDDPVIKEGKKLFNANCAACHKLNKRAIGPAL